MSADIYDNRSVDDMGEPLCTPETKSWQTFPTLPSVTTRVDLRSAAELLASECAEEINPV